MDFYKLFESIKIPDEKEIKASIKKLTNKDGNFLKLKELAKKKKDSVPDFIEYVYKKYANDIDAIAKKYDITFDKAADLFLAV